MPDRILLGQLVPVSWAALELFAQALSEFCPVHVTPDHIITCNTGAGVIEITWRAGRAGLRLAAASEAGLQNLRDTLGHLLESIQAGLPAQLDWQAEGDLEGRLPPNFRQARVAAVTRLSPGFIRLRLVAEDLGFLAQNGLHIRLLQPVNAAAPVWPRLNRNGRTIWPAATDLHMPVYTIRAIDVAAGWIDVDVFLHGHGRTCAWVQRVEAGAVVGLTGPGGGWMPQTPALCLGGDETALPAIARILENADPATTGQAMLFVSDPADTAQLKAPAGVQIDWIAASRPSPTEVITEHFSKAAARYLPEDIAATIQFAGEKSVAQAIRATLQALAGKLPATVTCAAYWNCRL